MRQQILNSKRFNTIAWGKKDKLKRNYPQNTINKTKDWATWAHLKKAVFKEDGKFLFL